MHQHRKMTLLFTLVIAIGMSTVSAQEKVYLDVKTRFGDKSDLTAVKTGTVTHLMKSDWAAVREVGEKYSLWLKNFEKSVDGKKTRIRLLVELRTPAPLRSGKLLRSQSVEVLIESWDETRADPDILSEIKSRLRNASKEMRVEANIVGERVVAAAKKMVDLEVR